MKSIVTGGAGFIGSHVARCLLDQGHEVIILDDLSGGFTENIDPRATFVNGSITDTELINQLFDAHQFDFVFHLAAYAAESLSHQIRRFNYENNLIGSTNLINASVNQGVKCFVFTSSIAVYGHQASPVTEDLIPRPIDPYGIAKYAVELDLKAAQAEYGLNSIIFRPHNVYGPGQNIFDPHRNVIGIFMRQLLDDEAMTIVGDGNQSRAFSYIDDVAPIIAESIQKEAAYNEVFNIGSDAHLSINELAEKVARALNKECKTKRMEERNEVKHAFADHSKLSRFFSPASTTLKAGLEQMANWAKTIDRKKVQHFQHIEINPNKLFVEHG